MSEDTSAKPEGRRRRTTRAGRRRVRGAGESQAGENWQAQHSTPPGADVDGTTLREEDEVFAADVDSELDEDLDVYEPLGDDTDPPSEPPEAGTSAPLRRSLEPSVPLVREPRSEAPGAGLRHSTTIEESIVFEDSGATGPDPDADVPTFPQIRLADLDLDAPSDPASPTVIVARATIVGDRPVSKSPAKPELRAQSPIPPPPVRVSPRPAPPPDSDDSGLQLMDMDESELDSARPPPSRSPPPPPPPPEVRARASSSGAPAATGGAARKPPPPPAAQPRTEERGKARKVRQWWERFFSEDYLMTVLPPTTAQVAKQVDFIEASLGVSKGGTILDVGCGLGLHAIELTRRGYLVVALDLSLAMITHASEAAQHQKLRLSFVHADIREMEFDGAFDAAICMGTTFGFFDDDSNRDVLVRLYQALRPGGRMLLDVVNRDYVTRFQPNLVWFEGDSCVCMEESDFNYFNARLNVKRTMMSEDGHQSNAEYSLRLYSLHELGLLMQQTGFRVLEVSGQEAIRGVFFGGNAPRILMLCERRPGGMPSPGMPPERHSGEMARPTSGIPGERASAEYVKIAKPGPTEG